MLFEKIEYSDSFPINIKIGNMLEDPVHYHQDIEFVFVLNGEVLLRSGYCSYDRDICFYDYEEFLYSV